MARLRAFTMPKWGIEMTEGTVAEWNVAEGDEFTKGDILCGIETAKITNEVEAEYNGTVRRLIAGSGQELPVGALLAVMDDGVDASAEEVDAFIAGFKPAGAAKEGASAQPAPSVPDPGPEQQPQEPEPKRAKIETNRPISPEALKLAEDEGVDIEPIEGSGRAGRITLQDVHIALRGKADPALKGPAELQDEDAIFASPLARRIAALHGLDLGSVDGTGPRGRISKSDVLARVPDTQSDAHAATSNEPFVVAENKPEIIPFDRVRKVVAKRLTAAKQDIPHFYLRTSARMDALLELRRTANLVLGIRASINDYLVMAASRALARHPEINVQLHGQELHHFPHADIAIAVASPKGLVTPIVRQADRMRIDQIAQATRGLIDKAQAGRLGFEEMEGGSFTISNLGMFGIENFDAIINPPQCAILAAGATMHVPSEQNDGSMMFESRLSLTLSVDHRAIDGAAGAQFLKTLVELLEEPERLFA